MIFIVIIVMVFKIRANTDLANTKPMCLVEIQAWVPVSFGSQYRMGRSRFTVAPIANNIIINE